MQNFNLRHKLHLHRYKIIILAVFLFLSLTGYAQKWKWADKNNPNYDERKLSYGFLIGLHTTTYQIKYADIFVSPGYDTVHSIVPKWKPGFSLGFLVNYRLTEFLDLRLMPKVAFYEHELSYIYTHTLQPDTRLVETTMVELPLLLKYKSERRGNVRMFMVGGIKPGIEASGKKGLEGSGSNLEVKNTNVSLEAGVGFDLYYPLFKFSPEIRFSHGIVDVLANKTNIYGEPLKRVNTNTVTIYFVFQ